MDLQPTLKGKKVTIRPIKADDWSDLYLVASNPEVWAVHPVPTRYQKSEFKSFFDGAIATGSAFSILENRFGQIIGSSRFYGYDPESKELEIGWTFIGVDYWGGDYNAEIKKLMLDYAFGIDNGRAVDCVVFWVGEENIRSRKAMQKIGGKLRKGTHTRGLSGDSHYVIYEISAKSWRNVV